MPSVLAHDLKTLVLSFHPVVAIESVEDERVIALVRGVGHELRLPVFEWSLSHGLSRYGATLGVAAGPRPIDLAVHGTTDPLGVLRHIDTLTIDGIFHLRDLAVHLSRPEVQREFIDVAERFSKRRSTIVLSGVSLEIPPSISSLVVHLKLQLPDADELRSLVSSVATSPSLPGTCRRIALKPDDVESLVRAMSGMTLNQARQALAYAALSDCGLSADDVPRILERKAQMLEDGGVLEFFPVDHNAFEIGGFGNFRAWLDRAKVGFSAEARALNLSAPRGVLIVGVQGCGKSLAAKVVAREWKLPLLKLDAGRLLDKFVGESEKNFRHAIDLAESMAPAVLWIDEIEKGFAAGSADVDGGLGRRLMGAFLTWLQEHKAPVFVAATANDLSAIPPELMRKRRFDEIFFVDLPDVGERAEIFKIHLRLRQQAPEQFDLSKLSAATDGFSGAEIEQAIVASLYRALHDKRDLDTTLLLVEIGSTVPLSMSRREDIGALRAFAASRFVSVR